MKIISQQMVLIGNNPEVQIPSSAIVYSDISPDPTNVKLAINADAICVSLSNLLSTELGERFNLPEYGINLPDYLFEIMDDSTKNQLLIAVYRAVLAWEPRVRLDFGSSYIEEDMDSHEYKVHLVFFLLGLDSVAIEYSGILTKVKSLFGNMYENDS